MQTLGQTEPQNGKSEQETAFSDVIGRGQRVKSGLAQLPTALPLHFLEKMALTEAAVQPDQEDEG